MIMPTVTLNCRWWFTRLQPIKGQLQDQTKKKKITKLKYAHPWPASLATTLLVDGMTTKEIFCLYLLNLVLLQTTSLWLCNLIDWFRLKLSWGWLDKLFLTLFPWLFGLPVGLHVKSEPVLLSVWKLVTNVLVVCALIISTSAMMLSNATFSVSFPFAILSF